MQHEAFQHSDMSLKVQQCCKSVTGPARSECQTLSSSKISWQNLLLLTVVHRYQVVAQHKQKRQVAPELQGADEGLCPLHGSQS